MTRSRDDHGSAGRGNSAGPFSLYQRLMGRPAGYDQIERFTRIGRLLEAGPDDSVWGLIVVHESYLVSMQENTLRTTKSIRAWCVSILATFLLIGLAVGGLTWHAHSIDIESAFGRQIDRGVDKAFERLASQAECSAVSGQPYCDALQSVNISANKQRIVVAVAALGDDTASILASYADLTQAFTWITRLSSPQWEQIRKMSMAQAPNLKGRDAR